MIGGLIWFYDLFFFFLAEGTMEINCFKCKASMKGLCAALNGGGKFPICLKCLSSTAIIYGADSQVMHCSPQGWTHHTRDHKGKLYFTNPRTMMQTFLDKDGYSEIPKKASHCSDCKKYCGLPTFFGIMFYCTTEWGDKIKHLLKMQCDECFSKDVYNGWWYARASTTSGGTVNRPQASVYIYSSPEVIKYDVWRDYDEDEG